MQSTLKSQRHSALMNLSRSERNLELDENEPKDVIRSPGDDDPLEGLSSPAFREAVDLDTGVADRKFGPPPELPSHG